MTTYNWPTLLRPGHDLMTAAQPKSGPAVTANYADAIDTLRSIFPLGPAPYDWVPKLVAGNANYNSTPTRWVPTDGSVNPGLGTGATQTGRMWQFGKWVIGDAEVVASPTASAVNLTGITSVVSTDKFITASAHNLQVGWAIVVAGFVNTTIDGTLENGSVFYVISDSFTTTAYKLSRTPGGLPINLTGAQDTGVTATATPPSAGIGFYRLGLPDAGDGVPLPCTSRANGAQGVVGGGHIFRGQGTSPLSPGAWRTVALHVAPTVDTTVCGIVVGNTLPASALQGGGYSKNNHLATRVLRENIGDGVPLDSNIAATTISVVGGVTRLHANSGSGHQFRAFDSSYIGKRVFVSDGTLSAYGVIAAVNNAGSQAGGLGELDLSTNLALNGTATGSFIVYAEFAQTDTSHVVGAILDDLGVTLGDNGIPNFGAASSPWPVGLGVNTGAYVNFLYETV